MTAMSHGVTDMAIGAISLYICSDWYSILEGSASAHEIQKPEETVDADRVELRLKNSASACCFHHGTKSVDILSLSVAA